jgi:hypothetical protein
MGYEGFLKHLYDFQTLTSGALAILAAIISGLIIWKTAFFPIQHKEKEEAQLVKRKRHYVALVLSRNFQLLATRAKQGIGTVIVTKAANADVTDKVKERMRLNFDPIINDWELMSLFPLEILTSIVDLRRKVEDHEFDIDRTGGAFGDDNFGEQLKRRLNSIEQHCHVLSNDLRRFIMQTNSDNLVVGN